MIETIKEELSFLTTTENQKIIMITINLQKRIKSRVLVIAISVNTKLYLP
jgi:hypothetical protein